MDLVTQGILGAAVGQVGFQRTLGRKALGFGALIGMLPDADVLAKLSTDICSEMLHHRGFTHSLFFAPLVAPIMGWLCNRHYKQDHLTAWIGLWFWSLITHPLLDVFTVYGTQLLAPFSDHRFSFCAVPIIDLNYSVPLLISIIIGWFIKNRLGVSQAIASLMLTLTTCYLFLGVAVRDRALMHVKNVEKIQATRTEAFTTMFSVYYRRIVIEEPHQFRIGFLNMRHPEPIRWHVLKKSPVLHDILDKRDIRIFYWFADEWVLPFRDNNSLILADVRFGADIQSIKGYWGMKITDDGKITRERFPMNVDLPRIKALWNTIFGRP